jgi:hypothetical protein
VDCYDLDLVSNWSSSRGGMGANVKGHLGLNESESIRHEYGHRSGESLRTLSGLSDSPDGHSVGGLDGR